MCYDQGELRRGSWFVSSMTAERYKNGTVTAWMKSSVALLCKEFAQWNCVAKSCPSSYSDLPHVHPIYYRAVVRATITSCLNWPVLLPSPSLTLCHHSRSWNNTGKMEVRVFIPPCRTYDFPSPFEKTLKVLRMTLWSSIQGGRLPPLPLYLFPALCPPSSGHTGPPPFLKTLPLLQGLA